MFVVDSSDKFRLKVAKAELDTVLQDEHLRERPHVPVLLVANKMDKDDTVSTAQCSRVLGLERIKERPWSIV